MGLWEGATENAAVCKSLLADLVARGLKTEEGDTGGHHKKRNVLGHLPREAQAWVGKKLNQAWAEKDYNKALSELNRLADILEEKHLGAARSLRGGLEEALTVNRLGLPDTLRKSLCSTNMIESAFDKVIKR